MFWYILIAVFLITLCWILLGPVIIFVDTGGNKYSVGLPGIFKASVVPSDGLFIIRGSVFFIPYHFNPFGIKRRKKRKPKDKSMGKKRSFNLNEGWTLGRNIMHVFRIRKLHMDVDTNDFNLNAWLIPAFSAVNSENIRLRANFEGNTSVLLDLRTRFGAVLWAFLKTKYKS
jgi:hypothetical protein